MKTYMLLMRGNQAGFMQMSPTDRQAMIQAHIDYSRNLAAKGILVEGDGLSSNSHLLLPRTSPHDPVEVVQSPYLNSPNQLSGFYLIKAQSQEEALEIAKDCPSLNQGETIEVLALEH